MDHALQKKRIIRIAACVLVIYFALAGILYWVSGEQMEAVQVQTQSVTPSVSDGGLYGDSCLEQAFHVETDTLDQILLYIWTFGRENDSSFCVEILEGDTLLRSQECSTLGLKNMDYNAVMLDEPLMDAKGRDFLLRIVTEDVAQDQCVSFYYGNTISALRSDVPVQIDRPLRINAQTVDGMLCMSLVGRNLTLFKPLYWPLVTALAAAALVYLWFDYKKLQETGRGLIGRLLQLSRYRFLLKQLVERDFKTRYKRSVLGVLWSILNPLLTMVVQYIVFSSLFRSTIPNFVVYLMSGGVLFSFFSESVNLGLNSILGNAALITKVYVPKYIYPVSRVLSSSVNLLISMIPFALMMLLSGLKFHKSILLLPLVLVYVTLFCIGMSLILSSSMVFFRDTQFLWSVLITLWTYMTPLFYPESIIPEQFLHLYRMNPMYQFIFFLRQITIAGVSPGPITFLYCTVCALVPLLFGLWIFRKTQDRFVFYL